MLLELPLWKITRGRIFNMEVVAYCVTIGALAFVPFAYVVGGLKK
jgi:hypothetical protein